MSKKRTIPKQEYEDNRSKADAAASKMREEIKAKKGPSALKGMEIDHVKPIAKGGSPTAKSNMKPIPKAQNRRKGAK